jgi:hypothetical protein
MSNTLRPPMHTVFHGSDESSSFTHCSLQVYNSCCLKRQTRYWKYEITNGKNKETRLYERDLKRGLHYHLLRFALKIYLSAAVGQLFLNWTNKILRNLMLSVSSCGYSVSSFANRKIKWTTEYNNCMSLSSVSNQLQHRWYQQKTVTNTSQSACRHLQASWCWQGKTHLFSTQI